MLQIQNDILGCLHNKMWPYNIDIQSLMVTLARLLGNSVKNHSDHWFLHLFPDDLTTVYSAQSKASQQMCFCLLMLLYSAFWKNTYDRSTQLNLNVMFGWLWWKNGEWVIFLNRFDHHHKLWFWQSIL